VQCKGELYNYDPEETICTECPSTADCSKGLISRIHPGYWRESNISDVIVFCLNNMYNCERENAPTDNGDYILCKVGTKGPLCESCDFYGQFDNGVEYFRSGNYECLKCSELK
jgi:hypothetical protein